MIVFTADAPVIGYMPLPCRTGPQSQKYKDEVPDPHWINSSAIFLRLIGIGWYISGSIAGATIGGWFVDRWLGTAPIFTIIGVILGVLVGFIGMFRMLGSVSGKR